MLPSSEGMTRAWRGLGLRFKLEQLRLETQVSPQVPSGTQSKRLGDFIVTCIESELAELIWLHICSGYGELLYCPVSGWDGCSRRGIQVACAGGPHFLTAKLQSGSKFLRRVKENKKSLQQTQASQAIIVAAQHGIMALISRIVI